MMETSSQPPRALSDDDLQEMLHLAKDSDSVELKLTVPEQDHRSTIAAIGIDPLAAQVRQVFFFDTPDLQINAVGLVLRARRVQGKQGDTVIKRRPATPSQIPPALRRSPGFRVEVDAMPGGFVCSGSLSHATKNKRVRDVASGQAPIRKLFTKEQCQLFEALAPRELELDDLAVLGPIFVLKVRWSPGNGLQPMVAELWMYPDGSRVLELSTKCLPDQALRVAAESRAYLLDRGISLSGEQETKTRKALEYFAGLRSSA